MNNNINKSNNNTGYMFNSMVIVVMICCSVFIDNDAMIMMLAGEDIPCYYKHCITAVEVQHPPPINPSALPYPPHWGNSLPNILVFRLIFNFNFNITFC